MILERRFYYVFERFSANKIKNMKEKCRTYLTSNSCGLDGQNQAKLTQRAVFGLLLTHGAPLLLRMDDYWPSYRQFDENVRLKATLSLNQYFDGMAMNLLHRPAALDG